jgi:hypothetical protein
MDEQFKRYNKLQLKLGGNSQRENKNEEASNTINAL